LDAKIQFFWESPKIFSEKLDANALKAKKNVLESNSRTLFSV